jgi:hypothetical protein
MIHGEDVDEDGDRCVSLHVYVCVCVYRQNTHLSTHSLTYTLNPLSLTRVHTRTLNTLSHAHIHTHTQGQPHELRQWRRFRPVGCRGLLRPP